MSLSFEDLQAIRGIVTEVINDGADSVNGMLEILQNDVNVIYGMLVEMTLPNHG